MIMTVKMQFTVSTKIELPLSITMKHLSCVKKILQQALSTGMDASSSASSIPKLDLFRTKLENTYGNVSKATWLSIRRQLLSFFEERHVKVQTGLKKCCALQPISHDLYCTYS
jgi:hypothetical protein